MKKITLLSFVFICFLLITPSEVLAADQSDLSCASSILVDAETGTVLQEMNSEEKHYPASVTKIMTLTLILEAVENGTVSLDDTVFVSEDAASMGGSQVFLFPGEERTVEEMLIAIAVGSGNDAAYAMAEYIGGSYSGFIDMMNEKAAEIGMSNTHFVNPHGLHDEEHYTTAKDLAKLAKYAMDHTDILTYTSIYEYEFRPEPNLLTLWNTNRLLKWYEGADGLKTGYTEEAGRNLVATAERDGLRLISVVLGCEERHAHFKESMNLLNYGFNTFTYDLIYDANTAVGEISVNKGKYETVKVYPASNIGYVKPKNTEIKYTEEIELEDHIDAPVTVGTPCGYIRIYNGSELIAEEQLIVKENIEKSGWLHSWTKLIKKMW